MTDINCIKSSNSNSNSNNNKQAYANGSAKSISVLQHKHHQAAATVATVAQQQEHIYENINRSNITAPRSASEAVTAATPTRSPKLGSREKLLHKYFRRVAIYENLCRGCGYGVFDAHGEFCNFCQCIVRGGVAELTTINTPTIETNIYENICSDCRSIYSDGDECKCKKTIDNAINESNSVEKTNVLSHHDAPTTITTPSNVLTETAAIAIAKEQTNKIHHKKLQKSKSFCKRNKTPTSTPASTPTSTSTSTSTSTLSISQTLSRSLLNSFFVSFKQINRTPNAGIASKTLHPQKSHQNQLLQQHKQQNKSTSLEIVHNVDGYANVFHTQETFDLQRICELKRQQATGDAAAAAASKNGRLLSSSDQHIYGRLKLNDIASESVYNNKKDEKINDDAVAVKDTDTDTDKVDVSLEQQPIQARIALNRKNNKKPRISRMRLLRSAIGGSRSKDKLEQSNNNLNAPCAAANISNNNNNDVKPAALYLNESICQWMTSLRNDLHLYDESGEQAQQPKSIPARNLMFYAKQQQQQQKQQSGQDLEQQQQQQRREQLQQVVNFYCAESSTIGKNEVMNECDMMTSDDEDTVTLRRGRSTPQQVSHSDDEFAQICKSSSPTTCIEQKLFDSNMKFVTQQDSEAVQRAKRQAIYVPRVNEKTCDSNESKNQITTINNLHMPFIVTNDNNIVDTVEVANANMLENVANVAQQSIKQTNNTTASSLSLSLSLLSVGSIAQNIAEHELKFCNNVYNALINHLAMAYSLNTTVIYYERTLHIFLHAMRKRESVNASLCNKAERNSSENKNDHKFKSNLVRIYQRFRQQQQQQQQQQREPQIIQTIQRSHKRAQTHVRALKYETTKASSHTQSEHAVNVDCDSVFVETATRTVRGCERKSDSVKRKKLRELTTQTVDTNANKTAKTKTKTTQKQTQTLIVNKCSDATTTTTATKTIVNVNEIKKLQTIETKSSALCNVAKIQLHVANAANAAAKQQVLIMAECAKNSEDDELNEKDEKNDDQKCVNNKNKQKSENQKEEKQSKALKRPPQVPVRNPKTTLTSKKTATTTATAATSAAIQLPNKALDEIARITVKADNSGKMRLRPAPPIPTMTQQHDADSSVEDRKSNNNNNSVNNNDYKRTNNNKNENDKNVNSSCKNHVNASAEADVEAECEPEPEPDVEVEEDIYQPIWNFQTVGEARDDDVVEVIDSNAADDDDDDDDDDGADVDDEIELLDDGDDDNDDANENITDENFVVAQLSLFGKINGAGGSDDADDISAIYFKTLQAAAEAATDARQRGNAAIQLTDTAYSAGTVAQQSRRIPVRHSPLMMDDNEDGDDEIDDHGEWETDDEFMYAAEQQQQQQQQQREEHEAKVQQSTLRSTKSNCSATGSLGSSSIGSTITNFGSSTATLASSLGIVASGGATDTNVTNETGGGMKQRSVSSYLTQTPYRTVGIFYSPNNSKLRAIVYDYVPARSDCYFAKTKRATLAANVVAVPISVPLPPPRPPPPTVKVLKQMQDNGGGGDDSGFGIEEDVQTVVPPVPPPRTTSAQRMQQQQQQQQQHAASENVAKPRNSNKRELLPDSVQAWKFMLLDVNYVEDEEDVIVSESEIKRAQQLKEEQNVVHADDEVQPMPMPSNLTLQRFKSASIGNLTDLPSEEEKKSIADRMRTKFRGGVFKITIRSPKSDKKARGGTFRRAEASSLYLEDGLKPKYPIFGAPLDALELNVTTQPNVPRFVVDIVEYIERPGNIDQDGLYRASGNKVSIDELKQKLCESYIYDPRLLVTDDIHTLTSLHKQFFRELGAPLIPQESYARLGDNLHDETAVERMRLLFDEMREPNRSTLRFLIKHLTNVAAYSTSNRMPASNLAIVWGPCLLSGNPVMFEIGRMNSLAKVLIEKYDRIFLPENERLVS